MIFTPIATILRSCSQSALVVFAVFVLVVLHAPRVLAQPTLKFVDREGTALRDVVVWTYAVSATAAANHENHDVRKDIDQRNKRFEPYVSVVPTDTQVFFPNSDDIRHHVYSFSAGNTFERKLYRANDADPVLLSAPGIVALGCNIHDNMQAYIVVSDESIMVSDDRGEMSISKETELLRVWHPLLGDRPIDISDIELEALSADSYLARLPFIWADPQAPRSDAQLESLLKQFSRDPQ